QRGLTAPQAADDGAEAGPVVGGAGLGVLDPFGLVRDAGGQVVAAGGVGVVVGHDGAEDGDPAGEFGGAGRQRPREQARGGGGDGRGDGEARGGGGDGPEVALDLGGGVGLGVPGLVLRRGAEEEQQDARPRPARLSGAEPAGQGQPEGAQAPDSQPLAAAEA